MIQMYFDATLIGNRIYVVPVVMNLRVKLDVWCVQLNLDCQISGWTITRITHRSRGLKELFHF
jgi:hypothetical protein